MSPLRPVNGVGRVLHPTQIRFQLATRGGEIFRKGVAAFAPLRSLIGRLRQADQLLFTGGDVDHLKATIRMVGVAENLGPGAVGRDVPGVEKRKRASLSRVPIHPFKRKGPDGEHQVTGFTQEGLVNDELLIGVLVQALDARAVPANAMHTRRGIGCEFDPLRFERVELRVDHGSREGNDVPLRAVEPAHDDSIPAFLANGCGDPLAVWRKRTFSELRVLEGINTALGQRETFHGPNRAASNKQQIARG